MSKLTHSEQENLQRFAREMTAPQRKALEKLKEGEMHVDELKRHMDLNSVEFDHLLQELNSVHALLHRQGRSDNKEDFSISLQDIFWRAKICPHCNTYIF